MSRRWPLNFYPSLRTLMDTVGTRRVLWGNDDWALWLMLVESAWAKAVSQPAASAQERGISFSEEGSLRHYGRQRRLFPGGHINVERRVMPQLLQHLPLAS